MSSLSVTNTFTPSTVAASSQVNANFADVVNYINDRNTANQKWDSLAVLGNAVIDGTLSVSGKSVYPNEIINVKAYGATGNGTTDDTTTIQAALDAVPANGGIVYFPNGTYKVSSVLTVSKPCTRLLGPGRRQRIATLAPSIINYTGTGNVINVTGNQGFVCEYLHFDYPAQSGTVINVSNVASGFIRNCHFVGTSKNGKAIDINDGSGWTFKDVDIEYFDIGIDLQQNNGDTLIENTAVSLCNTGTRIGYTASTTGVTMIGLDYELNGIGIDIFNANSVHIFGSYFEQDTAGTYLLKCTGTGGATPQNVSLTSSYSTGGGIANYAVYLGRVKNFRISDILTTNYVSGLINNAHTDVTLVSIERCDNISPVATQINDFTGVVFFNKSARVGIGPADPSTLLHLKTNGGDLPRISLEATGTRKWVVGPDTSPDEWFVNDSTAGTIPLRIAGSTGLLTTLPTYSNTTATAANVAVDASGTLKRSTSSLRYKDNIRDFTKGLDVVKSLNPILFKEKDVVGGRDFAGLLAEDIHSSGLTEFVEYDKEGRPDALFYSNMVVLLINAIKELNEKIENISQ